MARRLRIEYPLAIYHVMVRGNARRDIVLDDGDRQQRISVLERTVVGRRWELFALVLMSSQFHLLISTPKFLGK
jgi:putative transposase